MQGSNSPNFHQKKGLSVQPLQMITSHLRMRTFKLGMQLVERVDVGLG